MARIFIDTSALYALLDRNDAWHEPAKKRMEHLQKGRVEPLLTNFIVAECHALLLSRLGADIARRWLLTNIWPVERVTADDEQRATEIIQQYSDKSFSYTDATSFAVMDRLRLRRALAFDPHFQQYGLHLVGAEE